MFVGRENELSFLQRAIRERRSFVISGEQGAGKTALLNETLRSLPLDLRQNCICSTLPVTPHDALQELASNFAKTGNPEISPRWKQEAAGKSKPENWFRNQTSLRLRGLLRKAAKCADYSVFFDTQSVLPDGLYRLLQEWIWSGKTPVVVLARSPLRRHLGRNARLFWNDQMRFELHPLSENAATALIDFHSTRLRLSSAANREFREFVMLESGRQPGAILRLCELAALPKYRFGDQCKLRILRMDFHMERDLPSLCAAYGTRP